MLQRHLRHDAAPVVWQGSAAVVRSRVHHSCLAQVIRQYHGHLSGIYSLALHPTLDVVVTGGRDSVARVWDMRTKVQVCRRLFMPPVSSPPLYSDRRGSNGPRRLAAASRAAPRQLVSRPPSPGALPRDSPATQYL